MEVKDEYLATLIQIAENIETWAREHKDYTVDIFVGKGILRMLTIQYDENENCAEKEVQINKSQYDKIMNWVPKIISVVAIIIALYTLIWK